MICWRRKSLRESWVDENNAFESSCRLILQVILQDSIIRSDTISTVH
jgi:hypothetical protein